MVLCRRAESGRLEKVAVIIEHAGDTHVGMRREANEDSVLILPEENLFVVADGMGGHEAGEVASRLAVESISDYFDKTRSDREATWPHVAGFLPDRHARRLVGSLQYAHAVIIEEIRSRANRPIMGTTAVALYFADSCAYVAHVGDSRCYSFYSDTLQQITQDHTLANDLRHRYQLSSREKEKLVAYQHIVARALGGDESQELKVELNIHIPRPGERFLLCSDGLTGELSDAEIMRILESGKEPGGVCGRLIELANRRGGRDNITVVLADFVEGDPAPDFPLGEEETVEADLDEALMLRIPSVFG